MADQTVADIDTDVATAVGLWVLGAASLGRAADIAGTTRWKVEAAIENAGVAERVGPKNEGDIAGEIDALLDDET